LQFPNLNWALAQWGPRYRFAAKLGESESWLSRKMNGRIPFSSQEREVIAKTLGYPTEWLFQEPQPPSRAQIPVREEQAEIMPLFSEVRP
jgi:hypothetical protein